MGKSGKRKGYRPRPEKLRLAEAAAAEEALLYEERKKRLLRVTAVILAALLLLLAGWGVFDLIARRTGLRLRQTTAYSTPHCRVSGAMLAYYYHSYCALDIAANGDDYEARGLDLEKPLSEQLYDEKSGKTWAAYFEEPVSAALLRMVVFAEAAYREGLGAEDAAAAEEAASTAVASLLGEGASLGRSLSEHIEALYGRGVREADVYEAERLAAIAEKRQSAWEADVFTPAERQALYEANPQSFSVADAIVYRIIADTDGLIPDEYRDEYARAEARAQALAAAGSEEDFLAAVRADLLSESPEMSARALEKEIESLYLTELPYATPDAVHRWLFSADRAAGDAVALGSVGDYTVVFCRSAAVAPTYRSAAIRRIFFPYTAGASEASVLAGAEALLAGFAGGSGNEAAFAALAVEHGEDAVALAGGLVPSATRGNCERALADWLFLSEHIPGETAVVPAAFGVYLVYYVEESPYPLWEEWAITRLRGSEYERLLDRAAVKAYPGAFSEIPAVIYSF